MATFKNNYLFDYLRNIIQDKSISLYNAHVADCDFESSFSPFMVLRYLSMHKNKKVRDVVLEDQRILENFPEKAELYKYLLMAVPKQSTAFIKYIK